MRLHRHMGRFEKMLENPIQSFPQKWRISNHNYHLDSKSITRDLLIILIISSIIVIMREGFPFLIIPQKGRLLHTGALCFGVESFPVFLFFTWRDES